MSECILIMLLKRPLDNGWPTIQDHLTGLNVVLLHLTFGNTCLVVHMEGDK